MSNVLLLGASALWAATAGAIAYHAVTTSEPLLGSLAGGAMFVVPAALCLMALRRSAVLPVAVVAGYVVAALSFSLAPVFALVASMSLWAMVRERPVASTRTGLLCVVSVVLLGASFFARFLHENPRCTRTARSVHCSSDVTTSFEGMLSLAFSAAVPVAASRAR
jgi:hypothetical protein